MNGSKSQKSKKNYYLRPIKTRRATAHLRAEATVVYNVLLWNS